MEANSPKLFRISDVVTEKPVAIIEAQTEKQAIERFFQIQSQLSMPKPGKDRLWQCTEHLPHEPRTSAVFLERFFAILDSLSAVKH
jgi:hypothetical protein